ncbi:hypothetical protein BT63DRAFT_279896 [Microthyrium microscopicum]|uniref:Uncharacterized protein n=1 Tax=Microthyrium microscopicum TaxID=703497 RepID=A0A6A6UAS9_9PEZI|nr:hypothetical protein BT63DRAFT_279896 [Microthyrium microscopicum]
MSKPTRNRRRTIAELKADVPKPPQAPTENEYLYNGRLQHQGVYKAEFSHMLVLFSGRRYSIDRHLTAASKGGWNAYSPKSWYEKQLWFYGFEFDPAAEAAGLKTQLKGLVLLHERSGGFQPRPEVRDVEARLKAIWEPLDAAYRAAVQAFIAEDEAEDEARDQAHFETLPLREQVKLDSRFVDNYCLHDDGKPDKTKIKQPLSFSDLELHERYMLEEAVEGIPGLTLVHSPYNEAGIVTIGWGKQKVANSAARAIELAREKQLQEECKRSVAKRKVMKEKAESQLAFAKAVAEAHELKDHENLESYVGSYIVEFTNSRSVYTDGPLHPIGEFNFEVDLKDSSSLRGTFKDEFQTGAVQLSFSPASLENDQATPQSTKSVLGMDSGVHGGAEHDKENNAEASSTRTGLNKRKRETAEFDDIQPSKQIRLDCPPGHTDLYFVLSEKYPNGTYGKCSTDGRLRFSNNTATFEGEFRRYGPSPRTVRGWRVNKQAEHIDLGL